LHQKALNPAFKINKRIRFSKLYWSSISPKSISNLYYRGQNTTKTASPKTTCSHCFSNEKI